MAITQFVAGYSARDAASIVGSSPAEVRSAVRAGLVAPRRGPRGEYRFTVQDLVLLRTAKDLSDRIPARKLRRALRRLREQLPSGRSLAGLRITTLGEELVVREGRRSWKAESGQGVLDFEVAELAGRVAPLALRAVAAARGALREPSAQEWFELACDLELGEPAQARDAYRRVLELEPRHADARLNLGRLLHEAGQTQAAETHYRLALEARPGDPTAAFNLGVALEDLGRPAEAIAAYQEAVAADARCADAHFNLSRLYESAGQKAAAIRHLKACRALGRP